MHIHILKRTDYCLNCSQKCVIKYSNAQTLSYCNSIDDWVLCMHGFVCIYVRMYVVIK